MKLFTLLVFAMIGWFGLSAVSIAETLPSNDSFLVADPPGSGRTVTETWSQSSGGKVHYAGLGDKGTTSGKRYIELSDGTWQEDGTWQKDGDDVEVYAGETLVQTNHDMAKGKDDASNGKMTDELGNLKGGTWKDA